jgi:hypothetical protein
MYEQKNSVTEIPLPFKALESLFAAKDTVTPYRRTTSIALQRTLNFPDLEWQHYVIILS